MTDPIDPPVPTDKACNGGLSFMEQYDDTQHEVMDEASRSAGPIAPDASTAVPSPSNPLEGIVG